MSKMKTISISIDEKQLEKILKKVDSKALKQNSNRSAILRNVLLEGFGMTAEKIRPRNYVRSMSSKAE